MKFRNFEYSLRSFLSFAILTFTTTSLINVHSAEDWKVNMKKAKGEGDFFPLPKDVIYAHIINPEFLSTNEILNFGATCKSHYSLIQAIQVIQMQNLRLMTMEEAIGNAKNFNNSELFPERVLSQFSVKISSHCIAISIL